MNNNAEVAFQAALDAQRRGAWPESLTQAQLAIHEAPGEARYHALVGDALYMLARPKEAARSYEHALKLDPDHIGALNNLAVIYSLDHQYADAEALLHRSLAIKSDQLEAWLNLCSAVEGLDFRENDVVTYARTALTLAPDDPRTQRYLGKALLRQGNITEALNALETAAGQDPRNPDTHCNLGICHLQLDEVPEAIQSFQTALAIDPAHGGTYRALAEFLYQIEDWPAAEEACRHAQNLLNAPIAGDMLLAKILFAQGRYQEGAECHIEARKKENLWFKSNRGIAIPNNRFVLAPVQSVDHWCTQQGTPYREILPELNWQARPPTLFGTDPSPQTIKPARIPPAYVAEIKNATVLPGHEVILVDNEQVALYNRLIHMQDWGSLREDRTVPLISNDCILTECSPMAQQRIRAGIFMFSEGWSNYAHWLIEQIPRLYLLEQCAEYDGIPLLVNDGLYPQQLESLQSVSGGRYPIQILNSKQRHHVERLVFPTNLTAFIKRRYRPKERADAADGPFHPEAIHFLRQRLLPQYGSKTKPQRRLWVSRKTQIKTGQRRLINEEEIETLFLNKGFEIIFPETLTFKEQVEAFSGAEMIAGPAGAAMINTVFSPPDAKILIFTKNHPQVNFHYFTNIGQIVGFEVAHVCGQSIKNFGVYGFETDFTVECEVAKKAMDEFLKI